MNKEGARQSLEQLYSLDRWSNLWDLQNQQCNVLTELTQTTSSSCKNRGGQRYRGRGYQRTFQTLCRIKAPVLKEQTPKLCLERLALRAIGRILEVHHKIVCLWLVQAAEQLPKYISNTEACSVIEVGEIRSFFSEKITSASSVWPYSIFFSRP